MFLLNVCLSDVSNVPLEVTLFNEISVDIMAPLKASDVAKLQEEEIDELES